MLKSTWDLLKILWALVCILSETQLPEETKLWRAQSSFSVTAIWRVARCFPSYLMAREGLIIHWHTQDYAGHFTELNRSAHEFLCTSVTKWQYLRKPDPLGGKDNLVTPPNRCLIPTPVTRAVSWPTTDWIRTTGTS